MRDRQYNLSRVGSLLVLVLVLGLLPSKSVQAQAIQFSVYISSELTATKQQDLDFQTVTSGQGVTPINLGDPGMGVFTITGNVELDIIVTMDAPTELTHTGPSLDTIPFTLDFAYANKDEDDIYDAITVTGTTVRFPILARTPGPPGAPPTPPSQGHVPDEATAYLYIYGEMNVGSIDAGLYTGDVTLTVEYD